MSEIAEELERMASEFYKSRVDEEDRCARAMEAGAVHAEVRARARAGALEDVVNRLRERAAELRAQSSVPAHEAQPKPDAARAGQWWSFRELAPERVTALETSGNTKRVFFDDDDCEFALESELLSNNAWTYLGDGPEPAT